MAVKKSRRTQQAIQSVAALVTGRFTRYLWPASSVKLKAPSNLRTLATGFRPVDKAIGLGGLPRGYLVELIAPASSADSSGTICIATRIAAKAQRQQQVVTIIDLSHQFESWLAERCGLVAPHLLLTEPDTIFTALTTLERAAQAEGLVVIIAGQVAELFKHIDPALLKMLYRRLQTIVERSNCVFLCVTTPQAADPFLPTNYPAGFNLAELAAIRLWVQAESWSYQAGLATAYKANLTVIKNQLAVVGPGADIRFKFGSL